MATGSTLVAGEKRPAEWTFQFARLAGTLPAVVVGLFCSRNKRVTVMTCDQRWRPDH